MMEDNTLTTIAGTVRSLIYTNEDNGYAVLRLVTDDGAQVTLVGCVPGPAPGEFMEADGTWVTHPRHGAQFAAAAVRRRLPASEHALLAYLSSGVVKGIGKATAKLLVDHFGADVLWILADEPDRLAEAPGITLRRARSLGEAYSRQHVLRALIEFLASQELAPQLAARLMKQYGADALSVVRQNPYLLAGQAYGVPFADADACAMRMGLAPDARQRIEAAVLFELWHNAEQGHAYIPRAKLKDAVCALIGADSEAVNQAIGELCAQTEVWLENDKCYARDIYIAELNAAERVSVRVRVTPEIPEGLPALVARVENEAGLSYAPAQRKAVLMAVRNAMCILTGGPGTGKTTSVRAMVAIFQEMGLTVALAAPTGRAAKRLSELCGAQAVTIHRLLEAGWNAELGVMTFAHDEDTPLPADVVIVDECSMVDILLFDALLAALRPEARLVLVGDPDQLPAVGPGRVLRDLLDSGMISSVRLTEIFRQAAHSRIVTGAHAVNRGEMPLLEEDFRCLKRRDAARVVETIVDLCARRLPQGLSLDASHIQVLSPTRKGPCGTVRLNRALQEALNPPAPDKGEKRFGETLFREGDRIMQVRNNYDIIWRSGVTSGMGVFNGDMGRIAGIDPKAETVDIRFDDGREAAYMFEQLIELEPAYAVTVHKAQGSEYRAVVMALWACAPPLMNRRLLYTAITRARDWMILVGDENVLAHMVKNAKIFRRYSGLRARLV